MKNWEGIAVRIIIGMAGVVVFFHLVERLYLLYFLFLVLTTP